MTRARDKASAVVASFASTGIDDNADATAITIDSSENVALTGNATFVDNSEIQMGAGADLKVSSDGANAILRANNGRVYIQTDTGVNLTKTGNAETMLIATPDGSVDLYHNNSKKFETTSTGATITGATVTASGGSASAPAYAVTSGSLGANGLFVPEANTLGFSAAGTERMRLNSSGNLLIGRTNTNSNNGGHFITDDYGFFENDGTPFFINRYNSNGDLLIFRKNNSGVGSISTTGSSTAYNTSSDYRLKENVTYDWDATTRLKQLKPARFEWIADGDDAVPVDGFIAHEVSSIVPEAISGTKDEVEVWKDGEELPDGVSAGDNKLDADGNTIPVMQGIDQAKIVPLLVKTILELEARITALEVE